MYSLRPRRSLGVVEQTVASDDRDVAAAAAGAQTCLSARNRASRDPPVDAYPEAATTRLARASNSSSDASRRCPYCRCRCWRRDVSSHRWSPCWLLIYALMPIRPSSCPLEATNRTVCQLGRSARMTSSQQAMPPPCSLAQASAATRRYATAPRRSAPDSVPATTAVDIDGVSLVLSARRGQSTALRHPAAPARLTTKASSLGHLQNRRPKRPEKEVGGCWTHRPGLSAAGNAHYRLVAIFPARVTQQTSRSGDESKLFPQARFLRITFERAQAPPERRPLP